MNCTATIVSTLHDNMLWRRAGRWRSEVEDDKFTQNCQHLEAIHGLARQFQREFRGFLIPVVM